MLIQNSPFSKSEMFGDSYERFSYRYQSVVSCYSSVCTVGDSGVAWGERG